MAELLDVVTLVHPWSSYFGEERLPDAGVAVLERICTVHGFVDVGRQRLARFRGWFTLEPDVDERDLDLDLSPVTVEEVQKAINDTVMTWPYAYPLARAYGIPYGIAADVFEQHIEAPWSDRRPCEWPAEIGEAKQKAATATDEYLRRLRQECAAAGADLVDVLRWGSNLPLRSPDELLITLGLSVDHRAPLRPRELLARMWQLVQRLWP